MTVPKKTVNPEKPTLYVVEDKVYWQTAEGELIIPLVVTTGTMRKMRASPDDGFEQLFEFIIPKHLHAPIDKIDFVETSAMVKFWFESFEARQEARLGESTGSSENS